MTTKQEQPTLAARAERLRRMIAEPSAKERAQAELAEIERQLAVERETAARTAAEKLLLDAARAIGSLAVTIDERLASSRRPVDVTACNETWQKVCRRYELANALVKAFPGIKVPSIPVVSPPGRRGLAIEGLSLAAPRRLTAVITADMSAEDTRRAWREAAFAWLRGRGDELPEAIRDAVAPPSVAPTSADAGPESIWVPSASIEGDRFRTAKVKS